MSAYLSAGPRARSPRLAARAFSLVLHAAPVFSPLGAATCIALSLTVALVGCGETTGPARGPVKDLPPYTGEATELFDDGLDPASVGLELQVRPDPMTDGTLRQRVQTADAAIRVRVNTVTEKHEDNGTTYVLDLKTVDVFGGKAPADGEFQVHVGRESPSHGIVGSLESRLVGKTFIAAIKQFSHGGDDEGDLHFHLLTDDDKTIAAVKSAFALEGFRTTTTTVPAAPASTNGTPAH